MSKNPNDDTPVRGDSPEEYEFAESTGIVDTDQWAKIHQGHYDWEENGELSTELALIIADAKGVDLLDRVEMPPLCRSVDAQSLEKTFFGPSGRTRGATRTEL
jgi:hypothetical protein